jgi:hypothetical protein
MGLPAGDWDEINAFFIWMRAALALRRRGRDGFSVHTMRELLKRLNPFSQKQSPFAGLKVKGAVWVRPELRAEVAYRDFTIAPRFFQGAAGGRLVAVNEMERCGSLLPFDIITRTRALAPERTDDKGRGPDRASMPTARAKSAAVTVLAPEATPP